MKINQSINSIKWAKHRQGDVLTCVVSSSATIDQPPHNLIKTTINLRQGAY